MKEKVFLTYPSNTFNNFNLSYKDNETSILTEYFNEQLHDMFGDIWDYEIDHPLFQDTVGELMAQIIQAYKNSLPQELNLLKLKVIKNRYKEIVKSKEIG